MKTVLLLCFALLSGALASQSCYPIDGQSGLWYSVDGNNYQCASTTRYPTTGGKGSCGCGTDDGGFWWNYQTMTAAASSPIFGSGSWCGSGCGSCFAITPTGGFVDGMGTAPFNYDTQYIMITNFCPDGGWCDSPNPYGYDVHFDLLDQDMNGPWNAMGYNNAEVYYQQVDCSGDQLSNYQQCECANQ